MLEPGYSIPREGTVLEVRGVVVLVAVAPTWEFQAVAVAALVPRGHAAEAREYQAVAEAG